MGTPLQISVNECLIQAYVILIKFVNGRSVVFSCNNKYNWNIIEIGMKHHKPNNSP